MLNKKAVALGQLPTVVLTFVVIGISLALGATVMGNMKDTSEDANANTTIDETISGITELANWQETIAIVIAAAVILGLLGLFFSGRGGI